MELKENQTFNNRYRLIEFLGSGGFSEVWLAEDLVGAHIQVTLKIFATLGGLDAHALETFSNEYALVFNCMHPHLLKPMHYDTCQRRPYLVMQYLHRGSCSKICGSMSEEELARFLVQISSALQYLHEQEPPIIHQDIKPDNILIDAQGNYMLTDFGISTKIRKTLSKSIGKQQNSAGTTAYMAPERFSKKLDERKAIKANDVFSLGVTIFELLTDELPYGEQGGILAASGLEAAELPESYSPELIKLVAACLDKETWNRPRAAEIVKSAQSFQSTGKWLLPVKTQDTASPPSPGPQAQNPASASAKKRPTQATHSASPEKEQKTASVHPQSGSDKKKKPKTALYALISIAVILLITLFLWQPWNTNENDKTNTEQIGTSGNAPNIEMVYVSGGTFSMGCTGEQGMDCSDDEKPAHSVTVSSFYIGKYEITQGQWKAVMGTNPSASDIGIGDNYPVNSVSWNDIQTFISKLNQMTGKPYRLPTEAEWEFAARGGASTSSAPYKYSGSNNPGNVAWYSENSGSKSHPVGQKQANVLGLYDMSGNVWEWCSDWSGKYSSSSQTNPKGPASGSPRVLRGGSWGNGARRCRVAYRNDGSPDRRRFNCGFRLVLVPFTP